VVAADTQSPGQILAGPRHAASSAGQNPGKRTFSWSHWRTRRLGYLIDADVTLHMATESISLGGRWEEGLRIDALGGGSGVLPPFGLTGRACRLTPGRDVRHSLSWSRRSPIRRTIVAHRWDSRGRVPDACRRAPTSPSFLGRRGQSPGIWLARVILPSVGPVVDLTWFAAEPRGRQMLTNLFDAVVVPARSCRVQSAEVAGPAGSALLLAALSGPEPTGPVPSSGCPSYPLQTHSSLCYPRDTPPAAQCFPLSCSHAVSG